MSFEFIRRKYSQASYVVCRKSHFCFDSAYFIFLSLHYCKIMYNKCVATTIKALKVRLL